jgi:hypothetical protein
LVARAHLSPVVEPRARTYRVISYRIVSTPSSPKVFDNLREKWVCGDICAEKPPDADAGQNTGGQQNMQSSGQTNNKY